MGGGIEPALAACRSLRSERNQTLTEFSARNSHLARTAQHIVVQRKSLRAVSFVRSPHRKRGGVTADPPQPLLDGQAMRQRALATLNFGPARDRDVGDLQPGSPWFDYFHIRATKTNGLAASICTRLKSR